MSHLVALLLCVLSFGALALAMERHQHDVCGRALAGATTRWLRMAGWIGLALALYVLVQAQGWGMALVSFSGHTSLAAGLVCLAMVAHARRAAKGRSRPMARSGR